jgi:uncharacterized protein YceH (UPF0502 family)
MHLFSGDAPPVETTGSMDMAAPGPDAERLARLEQRVEQLEQEMALLKSLLE